MKENYFDIQNEVFEALMKRHSEDASFCFTLRKSYNKDTHLNYFTGTEKSSYFSFSMWDIKINYPGASIDPIVYRVILRRTYLKVEFQLHQTKTPDDEQNKTVLELIQNVDAALKSSNVSAKYNIVNNKPENKMFKVAVRPKVRCANKEELITQLMELIDDTTPLIDNELAPLIESNPDFDGQRVSKLVFDEMIHNRNKRNENRTKSTPTFQEIVEEVIAINNLEDNSPLQFGEIHPGYVWIGDNSGLIGSERAHYEIQYNQKLDESYALIHFEDEHCSEIKNELYDQLPNNFSWYKWPKGEGIKIGGFEMSSRPETPAILFDKLKSAEEQIGDKLRGVLEKIAPKKTKHKMKLLNQILYGPPGTGKTYSTIDKVVEICDPVNFQSNDHQQNKVIYDQLVKDGRVVFSTFHQSFSYEDFVEGIKPVLGNEGDKSLIYDIEPGIFKQIANSAKTLVSLAKQAVNWDAATFYKMSIGGKNRPDIHNWCIENSVVGLSWGGEEDLTPIVHFAQEENWTAYRDEFKKQFPNIVENGRYNIQASYALNRMRTGDIVVISKGNHIIDAIGKVTGEYYFNDATPTDMFHFREVEWIATDLDATPDRFIDKLISQQSIYEFFDGDIKLEAFQALTNAKKEDDKPYVIVIDEINRGNVSAIFGELITLIEEDKRIGQKNELRVTLPYSKERFGVPSNLYIIGTMNTADRSVEALDTALRRRFVFEEMLPKPELISPSAQLSKLMYDYSNVGWKDREYKVQEDQLQTFFGIDDTEWKKRIGIWKEFMINDITKNLDHLAYLNDLAKVNLEKLLSLINTRIEILVDRDHTIGHAFFMDNTSLADLKSTFANKVIPLLQEYFYGDYEKMAMVIGTDFFEITSIDKSIFAASSENFDPEGKIYHIRNVNEMTDDQFTTALTSLLKKKD